MLKGGMELPNWGIKLIRRLEEKGFEAYAVGGCVRDMLLGKKPEDYDFAVSALPDETKQALNGVPVLIPAAARYRDRCGGRTCGGDHDLPD